MIACSRSLVRFVARKNTTTLQYSQKCDFFHGLSCESKMDVRKGKRVDLEKKKRKTVTQTWRAVSTQPNLSQGDGGKEELEGRHEEVRDSVEATVSKASSSVGTLMHSEKHSMSMEIGESLMHFVKGKGGATQGEIETSTGAKIIFPLSKKDDSIIIEGNSAESVTKASEKVQVLIDKAVNSRDLDFSHFVSLPLATHPGLVEKLFSFQNTILGIASSDKSENHDSKTGADTSIEKASTVAVELEAEESDGHIEVHENTEYHSRKDPLVSVELKAGDATTSVKVNITDIPLVSYPRKESTTDAAGTHSSKLLELGIDKSIFIKPKTFHLTVLMLKLWNKDRVKTAAEVLQSVSPKVMDALENRPVLIRLKGLDCMKGSLSKARVVYSPVEEIGAEGRLLRACQVIIDAFVEAGLVLENDAQQKLKLHATLMNARHRKSKTRTRKVDSFDARGIFELYGSEEWGEYRIREAHLSQRFWFDEKGYYHCCASIPFPEDMQVD